MLLAIAKKPNRPTAIAEAAAALGLVPADIGPRMNGILPRILLLDVDVARLSARADKLETLGFVTLLCEPRDVIGDESRVIARTLERSAGGIAVIDRAGARHELPAHALELVQRGARTSSQTVTTKTTERKLSLGRAAMSGGLVLTKKVETSETHTNSDREAFVVVHRNDGEPDVMLYERRLDYRFLGSDLQPASFANLSRTIAWIRAFAPRLPVDDRVGRPGFVTGQMATPADPVDLSLMLVKMAHQRGAFAS